MPTARVAAAIDARVPDPASRSTVSGQSMGLVYSANVTRTLRPVLALWATLA
jgi:hypothetical protein